MYDHHRESVQRTIDHFRGDAEVRALLLGGSIAHGFAAPGADVDVMIVVGAEDYAERGRTGMMQFFDPTLCTYEGGYVDGKYIDEEFLRRVAEHGSEPARFAFKDAQILFSHVDGLEQRVRDIARYPVAEKIDRIRRFYAQFEAWHWYAQEGLKLNDRYLLGTAVSKLVLFGGRLILAHNELLYPYHKWFLKVLESAPDKPAALLERIAALLEQPDGASVAAFYEAVGQFRAWEWNTVWSTQFMLDSELTWMDGRTAVDDL